MAKAAPRKYFTLEEANKTLPLVRAIIEDVIKQLEFVNDLRYRLSGAALAPRMHAKQSPAQQSGSGSGSGSGHSAKGADRRPDFYVEEIAKIEEEYERQMVKLQSYLDELDQLGVEFKGPQGLCDFPSLREGREVYLCWKLGEPEIRFWHEIEGGFAGRQPIESL